MSNRLSRWYQQYQYCPYQTVSTTNVMSNSNPSPVELTDEQKAIVETDEDTIVVSNPGTGKTTTLSAKVIKLLEDGVEPENILCITFTVKAKKEMLMQFVYGQQESFLFQI